MHRSYLLKRPFDFCLGLTGFVLSLPLWGLICFLIWLEGKGGVFYVQERVGLNGRIFKVIKFRTMGYDRDNSRLPKLLRSTALDELPQLVNILKGEMSFVGPRPLIPGELTSQLQAQYRSAVRPGLTGVAQVLTSKNASILEKARYDLWYIDKQNILLDISLILRSFWVSLSRIWDSLAISKEVKPS